MTSPVNYFSFLVLAYNHQNYIVEHLESIKYLIKTYGRGLKFQIVVSDDCSKDKTVQLIKCWLEANFDIFNCVVTLNNKNIGTCCSVLNMMTHVDSGFCKLTAGDDVYSCENLFLAKRFLKANSIVSGIPLGLSNGAILFKKADVYNIIASSVIYRDRPLIDRFVGLSNNNAPNIFYANKYFFDSRVREFVSRFDVVEDWPFQVAISKFFPESTFYLYDKVFVYYRRTAGSTYIVSKGRFYQDQIKVFDFLISDEASAFNKILLISRRFCFSITNRFFKKTLNFAFYVYLRDVLLSCLSIKNRIVQFEVDLESHQNHYNIIRKNSEMFLSEVWDETEHSK